MKYGFQIFATTESIQPGELGKEIEFRGFETLLFSEHTHIPVNFLKNDEAGQNLPDYYWQVYDPFCSSYCRRFNDDYNKNWNGYQPYSST